MEFPIFIYRDFTEMGSWSRFIYKASRGSVDAVILPWAELTFVAERLGKSTEEVGQQTTEEVDHELARLIPAEQPFESLDDFLHHLHQWECMPVVMQTRRDPFHGRDYYASLWSRSLKVDEVELTYDAAAYCINHWTWAEYRLFSEIEDPAAYNSQDVVASMLFLITARQFSQEE